MSATATTPELTRAAPVSLTERRKMDWMWATFSFAAGVLILVAAFMPLWKLELIAPQYPKGLFVTSYGYQMTGDITELNGLNHYIGLKPLEPDNVFELKLFPFGVAGIIAIILFGAFKFTRTRTRLISVAAAASLPIVLLVDLQYWLYNYGHDIKPGAALHVDPFTPKVIGTTKVMNFHSVTSVTPGFWILVAAVVLLAVGPWLIRFVRDSWNNTGKTTAAASVIALLAFAGVLAADTRPAEAAAPAGSITDAIARAQPGDTIRIAPGTYREQLVIDKRVTLIGEGSPVIDGERKGDVVVIAAEGVTLRGFVIQGSGIEVTAEPAGVRVKANNATVDSNRIQDDLYGIVLEESDGHTITNNSVQSVLSLNQERQGNAVYLHNSHNNVLEHNTIEHSKDGFLFLFSDHNIVRWNTVTHVRYGIHFMYASFNVMEHNTFVDNVNGGVFMYSDGARFANNEFARNRSAASGYGLMFKDVDNVEVVDNLIHHNRMGIALEGSPFTPGAYVTITNNLIGYGDVGVGMFTTTDVTFSGNTFAGNLRQVEAVAGSVEHKNRWSLNGRGNYWDDYQGYDASGDGIGDLTYRYQGAFDALVRENPALRAYDYTPARMALDLAAKWFPAARPDSSATDEHPLMSATMTLARDANSNQRLVTAGLMLALLALPAAVFWLAMGSSRRRWATC